MNAILIAIVASFLAVFFARLWGVATDLRDHDRLVTECDEDLEQWVADDHHRLKQELRKINANHAERKAFHSTFRLQERADAKSHALHHFRDQERRARRLLAEVMVGEGWMHRVCRLVSHHPARTLTAPERVRPILDKWRQPEEAEGGKAPAVEPRIADVLAEVGAPPATEPPERRV